MLDIAWPELVVIGAVALVAIGPKDLPKVMRTIGKIVGKARAMTRDFQSAMDQLHYEADVADRLQRDTQRAKAESNEHEAMAAKSPPPAPEPNKDGQ